MGPIESRIRKLRRDFMIASGFETMTDTVLYISKDVWKDYKAENDLRIPIGLPEGLTFEGVETRIINGKDLIFIYQEELV